MNLEGYQKSFSKPNERTYLGKVLKIRFVLKKPLGLILLIIVSIGDDVGMSLLVIRLIHTSPYKIATNWSTLPQ